MGERKHDTGHDIQFASAIVVDPNGVSSVEMSSYPSIVHIVDDDKYVRESVGDLLQSVSYEVALYESALDFMKAELADGPTCLVVDVRLPGKSGFELQEYLASVKIELPVIFMTAFGDVPMSVKGMKLGAVDFLTKPIRDQDLLDAVSTAIQKDRDRRRGKARLSELRRRYSLLTSRERQVMALVASGQLNKQIANELSISEVTVKMHRGNMMRKLEAKSVAMLTRIAELLERKM